MQAVYKLNADELNAEFLASLKTLFKGQKITLTIEPEIDTTDYLLMSEANRNQLSEALEAKEEYVFTPEEFKIFSETVGRGLEWEAKPLTRTDI